MTQSGKRFHRVATAACLAALATVPPGIADAQERAAADVVVVVDTSVSMRQPGMDPERTSLLVSKLFADLVPTRLAVIRLLDLVEDRDVLPSRETGQMEPCLEDPSQMCEMVEAASDWHEDAREKKLGALERPGRGDGAFKTSLESHLEQRSNNSQFALAFRAAQGVLDDHGETAEEVPRTVIWLSDGRSDHPPETLKAIRDLREKGVNVEAIVFGRGDTALAHQAGIEVEQVNGPAPLMKAFAGAFRRMIRAPHELDARIADQPSFTMLPEIAEAWVVVYGDPSLGAVTLRSPAGEVVGANFAAEMWRGAGAYRVAYLAAPAAGSWTLGATGGGPDVAYAVVQFSALAPVLVVPERTRIRIATELVAAVTAGGNERISDKTLLADARLTAEIEGKTVSFQPRKDGTFTSSFTFEKIGTSTLKLRLESPTVDRRARAKVKVFGSFWETWSWLIYILLGILAALFVIGGFVLPHRFPRAFGLVFVPEREELDQQQPQPLRQWNGVRIGFYRSARAYLHSSFRISGDSRGALALLVAEKGGARASAARGGSLARETLESGWEPIAAEGCRVRSGDVFRCGDRGPYFRVARGGQG
jgi:hypothetical protein